MRQTQHFPLEGGLNEVTPPLSLKGGELYGVLNYEPGDKGGYRRIDGYERLDGRLQPSDASYWILNFDAGDIVEPEVGCTVFCTEDSAKAEVGAVVLESGTWAGGDAAGYLVLYQLTGFFEDNEPLSFTAAGDGFDTGFSNGFG
ncbi:MAG: hypothetical protein ABUK13_02740 [Gammaproteobacteria bacterium]